MGALGEGFDRENDVEGEVGLAVGRDLEDVGPGFEAKEEVLVDEAGLGGVGFFALGEGERLHKRKRGGAWLRQNLL